MIRVFTDFNARSPSGKCWLLVYCGNDLDLQMSDLGLTPGDRVILFQDGDDFEVEASLSHEYVDVLGRKAIVGVPDWSTYKSNT